MGGKFFPTWDRAFHELSPVLFCLSPKLTGTRCVLLWTSGRSASEDPARHAGFPA